MRQNEAVTDGISCWDFVAVGICCVDKSEYEYAAVWFPFCVVSVSVKEGRREWENDAVNWRACDVRKTNV